MTQYRVVSERSLEGTDMLYEIEARRWWMPWRTVLFSVICRMPMITVVDAHSFVPVNLWVTHAVVRHLDLVGKRERMEAAELKCKYQQKRLDR